LVTGGRPDRYIRTPNAAVWTTSVRMARANAARASGSRQNSQLRHERTITKTYSTSQCANGANWLNATSQSALTTARAAGPVSCLL
jgi:hypothetical protein